MMPVKYIYLDDEPPAEVRPYVREIQDAVPDLEIAHHPPQPYAKQIPFLRESERSGAMHGLVLDLRLDQFPNWKDKSGEKAEYRASTLAQEIRTRATEGNLAEYPIVLWSTDKRLKRSYTRDDTSHDLFDMKVLKSEIETPEGAERTGVRMVSLVSGYREIIAIRSKLRGSTSRLYRFLGFNEEPEWFDHRVSTALVTRESSLPAHEYARFILRNIIETPGPLIDRSILAARLGIDLAESPDFERLVARVFKNARYQGVFREGWPRWWSSAIDAAWSELRGVLGPLRSATAEQRVALLKTRSRLNGLVAAKPVVEGQSDRFWTVCCATGLPLDPRDGFLVEDQPRFPWQDRLYVSLYADMNGALQEKHLRLAPLEERRLRRARLKAA